MIQSASTPCAAGAPETPAPAWDSELFVLCAGDRDGLRREAERLAGYLRHHPGVDPKDLAFTLNVGLPEGGCRLALVAKSAAELGTRLARAAARLADPGCTQIKDAAGIYFFAEPLGPRGRVAFLFPGEGAQYLNMLEDLFPHFPEVREWFDACDRLAAEAGYADRSLRRILFIPRDAPAGERARAEQELRQLGNAMYGVLMADWALFQLLGRLGLRPDATAGHSMGELAALGAAGAIEGGPRFFAETVDTLDRLQREEAEHAGHAEAVLLAVGAGREQIAEVIAKTETGPEVYVAMDNCPHQTVVVGRPGPMAAVEAELHARRLMCERLPFGRPYHTPLFAPRLGPLGAMFAPVTFRPPAVPVYSCTTARPFPPDPAEIRRLTVEHWASPVRFTELITNMHADGVRIFIESGPRGNLTTFAEDILRGKPAAAVASNVPRRSGVTQLNHLAAVLAAHHVPLRLEHFYERRRPRRLWGDSPAPPVTAVTGVTRGAGGDGETAPSPPAPRETAVTGRAPRSKTVVINEYLNVMEQFLGVQREVMGQFLARRARRGAPAAPRAAPAAPPSPAPARLPMLGEVVRHDPGLELVVRRRLDLAEDRFALDHTVGGRGASKVDPDQNGYPILPMTFDLEIMAEMASVLVPGKVVTALKKVRLLRWLPYDDEEPTAIEARARRTGPDEVAVEIRDLGNASRPVRSMGVAAQGTVVLADRYPPAPPAGGFALTNAMPSRVPLEVLYKNLFHGPRFMGVRSTDRFGDEGIESRVEVLPRDDLFRSTREPAFLLDPILLDVAMHPLASWHLEQPDQAGRILLPVELASLEVFGPCPAAGTRFVSRGRLEDSSHRHFTHGVDLVGEDGRLWCRMTGVRYWRFYVPFGEVNFHGPKDEYFLSKEWDLPFRATAGGGENGPQAPKPPGCLMRLVLRPDILQTAIRTATACVTLAPAERRQFKHLTGPEKAANEWLYRRVASKDAVRTLWWHHTGERLFPADIELELDGHGRGLARRRGEANPEPFARSAVAYLDNAAAVGLAVFGPYAGVALERAVGDEREARRRCARAAVAQALALEQGAVAVAEEGPGAGVVRVGLDGPARATYPEFGGRPLVAETARDGDLIVAVTTCETEGE